MTDRVLEDLRERLATNKDPTKDIAVAGRITKDINPAKDPRLTG